MPDVSQAPPVARWRRSLHQSVDRNVVASAKGVLVTGERSSRLVRLDPATGDALWETRVEDLWGVLVTRGDVTVYLSQAGTLTCFSTADGSLRWSRAAYRHGDFLTLAGDHVVAGGWRGYRPMERLRLADGLADPWPDPSWGAAADLPRRRRWEVTWPAGLPGTPLVATQPVGTRDVRIVDVSDGRLVHCVDVGGEVRGVDRERVMAAVAGGWVLVVDDGAGTRDVVRLGADGAVARLQSGTRVAGAQDVTVSDDRLWWAVADAVWSAPLTEGGECVRVPVPERPVALAGWPGGSCVVALRGHGAVVVDPTGRTVGRLADPPRVQTMVGTGEGRVHVVGNGVIATLVAD